MNEIPQLLESLQSGSSLLITVNPTKYYGQLWWKPTPSQDGVNSIKKKQWMKMGQAQNSWRTKQTFLNRQWKRRKLCLSSLWLPKVYLSYFPRNNESFTQGVTFLEADENKGLSAPSLPWRAAACHCWSLGAKWKCCKTQSEPQNDNHRRGTKNFQGQHEKWKTYSNLYNLFHQIDSWEG